MKITPRRALLTVVLMIQILLSGAAEVAAGLHDGWDRLLKRHVQAGTVDYGGFQRDREELAGYLAQLAATSPESLTPGEQLALYINAYNAYTIKLILDNYEDGQPVESIKDIGGFFSSPWSIEFVEIGGQTMTLDTLEHEIIRPRFQEPRVHFAVNCASKSCPPLIAEAYRAASLERQLEENTIRFINDQTVNRMEGNTIYLSKIFDWFEEDFGDDLLTFIRRYARGELKKSMTEAGDGIRVRYLEYDWSLNGS